MHVDEKKIKSDNLLNSVKVVLVGTTHPGNIGATARAMKNMGILDLALVEPKEFPSDVATFRSKAAKDILEKASVHRSLAEAVSECELVVGTSARGRTVPWPVLNPREAAEEMHKSSRNGKVAIVFGREDRGLTNEELGLCNFHVHIPSDPEYSSLNLSQAVQILAYEIRLSYLKDQHVNKDYWDVELANNEQTERLINHMDELMQEVDFYDVENPRKLLVRVRRFFKRSKIDVMEANIFRGLFATIQKKLK
jgi:tRNA (cytidine32/uridine32-2'-O)-methyltransferase